MAAQEPTALVLEDTDLGRWALTRALEARGFEVRTVLTWPEASAWLAKAQFSLVLVAVSSPGHAAEIAAEVKWHPHVQLVLLAEEDIVGDVRMACGHEPGVLAKPFDLEEVDAVALSCRGTGGEARRA
jgi:DNA-binding response OmpR family regulator